MHKTYISWGARQQDWVLNIFRRDQNWAGDSPDYSLAKSHSELENHNFLMGKSSMSMAISQFANCSSLPFRVCQFYPPS